MKRGVAEARCRERCSGAIRRSEVSWRQWDALLCDWHWARRQQKTRSAKRERMRRYNEARSMLPVNSKFSGMDICTGTGSMRKKLLHIGFSPVWSVDVRASCRGGNRQRFLQGDLRQKAFQRHLVGCMPDMAWASVPCEEFSRANTIGRSAGMGISVLKAVICIFRAMSKQRRRFVALIENPLDDMRSLRGTILKGWSPVPASHCMYSTRTRYRKNVDIWVQRKWASRLFLKKCMGWNCPDARWNSYTERWYHPEVAQAGPSRVKIGPGRYEQIPGTRDYDMRIQKPSRLCATIAWQVHRILAS